MTKLKILAITALAFLLFGCVENPHKNAGQAILAGGSLISYAYECPCNYTIPSGGGHGATDDEMVIRAATLAQNCQAVQTCSIYGCNGRPQEPENCNMEGCVLGIRAAPFPKIAESCTGG